MIPLFSDSSIYQVLAGLVRENNLPFLVAIVAILVGGILGIVKLLIRHRERMTMIEHGMHPDFGGEEPKAADDSPTVPAKGKGCLFHLDWGIRRRKNSDR